MTTLHFLASDTPLTKSYTLESDGTITKTPYPNAYLFTSIDQQVRNVAEFADALRTHAEHGHCLLKGRIAQPLRSQSRAGSTTSTDNTDWICLDFDGLPAKHKIDELLTQLGLGEVSYVLQWSASYLIPKSNDDLRCHVFMLLDSEIPAIQLKDWLMQLNLKNEFLRANTRLSASGSTLKWGLDVTACQNDKLLYITDPTLKGLPNPFGRNKSRISIVTKSKQRLKLDIKVSSETVREDMKLRVNELRAQAGLPERKTITYKNVESSGVRAVSNADTATITGMREDRGFVYFNLNGGDSWGYYHPRDNADVIYNFKGEDAVLTSALLPDYYLEAKKAAKAAAKEVQREVNQGAHDVTETEKESEYTLLAFRDRRTAKYMAGRYTPATDTLDLDECKSEKQVRDFCAQFGLGMGEYVPIWELGYDPQSLVRVDRANMKINAFQLSPLLKQRRSVKTCPPTIYKLIHHALGGQEAITQHFMNWLAFVVQKRTRPTTAWIMYGTEGTGKGVLVEHVIKPLLGASNVAMNRLDEMSKGYNGFLKNKLLVAFDEAHVGVMKDAEEIMGKLRNMITEPQISIRDLYSSAKPVDNHLAVLLLSNKRDAALLSNNDRRYNVGGYQHTKLKEAYPEVARDYDGYKAKLESEMKDFAAFMLGWPVNVAAATAVLETEERQEMIEATSSSADDVAEALTTKPNMQFFLDLLPTTDTYKLDMKELVKVDLYRKTLVAIMVRTMERLASPRREVQQAETTISRDELRVIFDFTVGNIPDTAHKFTKYLGHRHVMTKRVGVGGSVVHGIATTFADSKNFPAYIEAMASYGKSKAAPQPAAKKPAAKTKKA